MQFAYAQEGNDSFFSADYKQALATARSGGRPAFVEITEKGCVFCRKLEQETLSDPSVRRALEPYEHVQVWWDRDAEQKAYAKSLLDRTAFPTLVFLDANGQPVYRTMGYRKPDAFIAECAKASDLLGVAVPYDTRSASQDQTPTGTVIPRQASAAGRSAGKSHTIEPGIWTASKDEQVKHRIASEGFNHAQTDNTHVQNQGVYSPIKNACFEVTSGNPEKGISILNQIVQSDSRNAQAHYLLAVAYVKTRRNNLAAQQYRLVMQLEPNSQLCGLARQGLQKIGH
jgi:hypothetical protein